MKIITIALTCLVVAELAHSQEPKKSEAASLQGHDEIISQLRTTYAAFKRGDFEAAVAVLVAKIEWTPLISGFPETVPKPHLFGRRKLPFERKQLPQVVDIRHIRIERMEGLEPRNILRNQQVGMRRGYNAERQKLAPEWRAQALVYKTVYMRASFASIPEIQKLVRSTIY